MLKLVNIIFDLRHNSYAGIFEQNGAVSTVILCDDSAVELIRKFTSERKVLNKYVILYTFI